MQLKTNIEGQQPTCENVLGSSLADLVELDATPGPARRSELLALQFLAQQACAHACTHVSMFASVQMSPQ